MTAWRMGIVVCMLSIAAAGCDESLSSVAGPTPDLTPTFSSIQRDIFEAADAMRQQLRAQTARVMY